MQLAPQTVNELQNAAGFSFDDGLHHQLPALIQDGDHNGFLVHVHSDIFDVVTHSSCLLGGKLIRVDAWLSLKVKCHSPADLPMLSCGSFPLGYTSAVTPKRRRSGAKPCTAQRSRGGASSGFGLLKRGALS